VLVIATIFSILPKFAGIYGNIKMNEQLIAKATQNFPRLVTVAVAAKIFAEAGKTQAAIRADIFKSEDRQNSRGDKILGNGLAAAGAIVRKGRKVLIFVDRYGRWLAGEV
jgi:hypothetical protein